MDYSQSTASAVLRLPYTSTHGCARTESKFYCFGGIETFLAVDVTTILQCESKFYCFGGIETMLLAMVSQRLEKESKFYCFGGIETTIYNVSGFQTLNLNSTASAVLRHAVPGGQEARDSLNLNSTASAVLRRSGYQYFRLNYQESKFYCFGGIETKRKGVGTSLPLSWV